MRLATSTRYTLCTIKSVDVCHEWHVVGATLLVWHHQSLGDSYTKGLLSQVCGQCTAFNSQLTRICMDKIKNVSNSCINKLCNDWSIKFTESFRIDI